MLAHTIRHLTHSTLSETDFAKWWLIVFLWNRQKTCNSFRLWESQANRKRAIRRILQLCLSGSLFSSRWLPLPDFFSLIWSQERLSNRERDSGSEDGGVVYCFWRKRCRVTGPLEPVVISFLRPRADTWRMNCVYVCVGATLVIEAESWGRRTAQWLSRSRESHRRGRVVINGNSSTKVLSRSPRHLRTMQECLSSSTQQLCLYIWTACVPHTCLCNANGICSSIKGKQHWVPGC